MKPFAVMNLDQRYGLEVLEAGLAAAKICRWGYDASTRTRPQQSPYRWGSADNNATAVNSAEVIGKQLVGKKAEFGGDDVNGQTRKFGVVYRRIDRATSSCTSNFSSYGGKVDRDGDDPDRATRRGAGRGADDRHADEERGRHHHRAVHRLPPDVQALMETRDQAGLLPRVVLHRRVRTRTSGSWPATTRRAGDSTRSGSRSSIRRRSPTRTRPDVPQTDVRQVVLGCWPPGRPARATASRSSGC